MRSSIQDLLREEVIIPNVSPFYSPTWPVLNLERMNGIYSGLLQPNAMVPLIKMGPTIIEMTKRYKLSVMSKYAKRVNLKHSHHTKR